LYLTGPTALCVDVGSDAKAACRGAKFTPEGDAPIQQSWHPHPHRLQRVAARLKVNPFPTPTIDLGLEADVHA
jgi:hypothetical protein